MRPDTKPITVFTFERDPGHCWLLVSEDQIAEAGLSEADFSPHSYRSPDGVIALEEDCDAALFIKVWLANIGQIRFRTQEGTRIRSWASYGTKRHQSDKEIAEAAIQQVMETLDISRETVIEVMANGNWGSVEELLRREFRGSHKGYHPSCGMSYLPEAILAELFDTIAITLGDPRRAVRWNP